MTRRAAFSGPLCLLSLFGASALATQAFPRVAQTQAQCSDDYNWASNSRGDTPCLLTAKVWGSCFNGNWDVVALPKGDQYDNPNSTTANLCTCSWAAYNLISACTECQGLDSSVNNWAGYSGKCASFETDTYFPSNVTLPSGTAIPFWAGTDPRTWNNARFDPAQAKLLAQENKPDYVQGQTPPDSQKKKKTPVGAIVGGVIGGLAVVALGAGIAFWWLRKRTGDGNEDTGTRPFIRPQIHGRSTSDVSGKSFPSPQSMSVVHRARTIYTTSNTIHTRTGSAHSLPYGSGYTSPARVMSPPLSPVQMVNREDYVEPYTLRAASTSPPPPSMTRKASETTLTTTYANHEPGPAATFMALGMASADGSSSSERTRLNPPPYSAESPEPGDASPSPSPSPRFAPGHRARPEKGGSVDSQRSYDSNTTAHAPRDSGTGSTIGEVIERMGIIMGETGTGTGTHTVSTGQSATVIGTRPTYKPGVSNPDNDTQA
ncbi:hypothetical protein C8R46DRAFT_1224082 [Mycena filopes]|nr:hypothetical protein C8R46DRAFT_1224082 [Mycena filopes]